MFKKKIDYTVYKFVIQIFVCIVQEMFIFFLFGRNYCNIDLSLDENVCFSILRNISHKHLFQFSPNMAKCLWRKLYGLGYFFIRSVTVLTYLLKITVFFVREGENIAGTLINIWPKKVCLRYFLGGKKQKILQFKRCNYMFAATVGCGGGEG